MLQSNKVERQIQLNDTLSDIKKYAEDTIKLRRLRRENVIFKHNWQELAAELSILKQKQNNLPPSNHAKPRQV